MFCVFCNSNEDKLSYHGKGYQRTERGSKSYHDLSDTLSVTKILKVALSIPDKSSMGVPPWESVYA